MVVLFAAMSVFSTATADDRPTHVLIVVGPSNHPPGTHEVAAGARLMAHCIERAENVRGLKPDIYYEWPQDKAVLDRAATIVFTGDRFPPMEMPDSDKVMADVGRMMDRGRGIVCVHYATGLAANHVAPDGAHPLLGWMGGYFATRCPHHQSIARIYEKATIEPAKVDHPVLRGWNAFTLKDEPYINNYFGKEGMAANVTPLAVSQLPPENPKEEVVAWAVSRGDGGRGAGIVMPHFYRNWKNDDLRQLIMNAIVWTARRDVPASGVHTAVTDLDAFRPSSVDPRPRKAQ